MRLPSWTQTIDHIDYMVIICPEDWAEGFSHGLNHAEYLGLEWTVRRNTWLVGYPRHLRFQVPDEAEFRAIDPPEWCFDND